MRCRSLVVAVPIFLSMGDSACKDGSNTLVGPALVPTPTPAPTPRVSPPLLWPLLRLVLVVLASVRETAHGQTPAFGPPFQVVDGSTTMPVSLRDVAMDGGGNFIVVWSANPSGVPATSFAKRYDFQSAPQGAAIPLAGTPHVAMDAKGNFVAAWDGYGSPDNADVLAQRYDNTGAALGGMFLVNSYTTDNQVQAAIGMNSDGEFVVAWRSWHQEGSYGYGYGVYAQRYDNAGVPQGGEFHVNTYTPWNQDFASVAMDPAGNFVIAWAGDGEDQPGYIYNSGIFFQRFNSSGAPLGVETPANTFTFGDQVDPQVAVNAAGAFVVVWTNNEPEDGSGSGVFARRFDPSGIPQSGEFRVNTSTLGYQSLDSIRMNNSGDFVVSWNSADYATDTPQVFVQRFNADGRRVGPEFQVNSETTNRRYGGSVALNDAGNMIIAWSDGDFEGFSPILARRVELYAADSLAVDVHGDGTSSDLNGVLEPGETVVVEPAWHDTLPIDVTFTGTASNINGPAGPSYTIGDASADYGTLASGNTTRCFESTADCYAVTVSGVRPAPHWDVTFDEALSPGFMSLTKTWTLHVGESFADVPVTHPFYKKIETLLHNRITSGCTVTTYCPGAAVARDQMAIFLARAIAGRPELVPTAGFVSGQAYNCSAGGHSLFTDVSPTNSYCKHVHYLAAQNVTTGCGNGEYCPAPDVTRDTMASFIAKAIVAPQGPAGVPVTYSDSGTGRSYSCSAGSPNVHFTDVPLSNSFCAAIHFLWAKGVVDGCTSTTFCPSAPVARDAMAKFLVNAFGLKLYGP